MQLKYYCDDMRHLVCILYSIENLHKMAEDLGIKKCWYHPSKDHQHYDLPKRRIKEIQSKCEIISSRDMIKIMKGTYEF